MFVCVLKSLPRGAMSWFVIVEFPGHTIRIYHECEGRIEKSVLRSRFGITRLAE